MVAKLKNIAILLQHWLYVSDSHLEGSISTMYS